MRVGLAGCGGIARQYHLRALLADPRVELVAIADPSATARADLAEVGAELLADPADLVARDDVAAVVVCAPTPAHAEIAERVATAGKHLYLEKPVALDLARARAVLAASAAGGGVSAAGFNLRFNPAFVRLRERLRAGEIGTVRAVRGWHCEAPLAESAPAWKLERASGGGVALDLASHSVDMARWLLGDEIEEVDHAAIASRASEHDDLTAAVRTGAGVPVELVCSYVRGRMHRWELEGERGVLRAERWPRTVRRSRRPSQGPGRLSRGVLALPIPRREPSFALALERFVGAALGDGDVPATIDDGVRSLEAVLAIESAAGVAGGCPR